MSNRRISIQQIFVMAALLSLSSFDLNLIARAAAGKKAVIVSVDRQAAHGPLLSHMQDGKAFIDEMVEAAEDLDDYSFQFEMSCFKKGCVLQQAGNFYFKKPRLIRLEVTDHHNKGAVAVLKADGKVRAHLGGALKYFVVTLSPYAKELRSVNDYPLVDSDFLSLSRFLQNWVKQGIRSRVSDNPVTLDCMAGQLYVLEMYKDGDESTVLKRVFVDADSDLPVEWYDYVDGRLWSISHFKNVRINTGLSDDLFTLK